MLSATASGYNSLMPSTLNVSEVFRSIQGEASRAGLPCAFVRLAGCNLRCRWCDTRYAWEGGRDMTLAAVLEQVREFAPRRVEVTGGEPLIQPGAAELLTALCDEGYETLLETNGSQDISVVDPRVVRIVDFKCPSSGEADANLWSNVEQLTPRDEVKFVLADRADYTFSRAAIAQYAVEQRCAVLLSPVADRLAAADLARWILDDNLDVRLSLQLHRIIWPDVERGV